MTQFKCSNPLFYPILTESMTKGNFCNCYEEDASYPLLEGKVQLFCRNLIFTCFYKILSLFFWVVNLKFTTLLLTISPTASEFLLTTLGLTSQST